MAHLSKILKQEAKRSNGNMVISKVPESKQPTSKTIFQLENEISAQIKANEDAEHRSYVNAKNTFY